MDTIDSKKEYKSPQFKVIEMNVSNSILSGSDDNGAVTLDDYTEDTLEW